MNENTLRIQAAAASVLLSRVMERLAHSTLVATGVHPHMTADAPNTWEDLQAFGANLNLGSLPVWNGASDNTIYDGPAANHAFRFWHDMGHLDHDLSFTAEDETTLQLTYHMPIVFRALGVQCICAEPLPLCAESAEGLLAARLYYADTIGQIEYNARHHAFPTNQREFAIAYVIDPSTALSNTY